MQQTVHPCCARDRKPLDEKQRDTLLMKILRLGNEHDKDHAMDIVGDLKVFTKEGYDVDSYFIMFTGFLQRYGFGD